MSFPFPLFSPACPLTGNSRHFSTDLAAFEHSLHATIPNASLTGFAPLSAGPFRQRSTGWNTGSVGVTIGEQSAIRLTTSEADVVRLCIPMRGGSRYRRSGRDLASEAGNAWVFLAQQGVNIQTSDDHCGVALSLNKARLGQTAQTMLGMPELTTVEAPRAISLQALAGQRASRALFLLLLSSKQADPIARLATEQWAEDSIYRFVARLLPDPDPAPREPLSSARTARLVDAACGFMMTRIDTPPTLTEVESAAGASARVLQMAFSAHLGTTPLAWFKEQRLLLARELLRRRNDSSVTDVALACGFSHLGRFSRDFRARWGVTPSEGQRRS